MRALYLLLLLTPLWGQDRGFKAFYDEGLQLLKAGNYAEAAERFQEAYRIDSKPQSYRVEGTFFEYYMPCYRLALCYEQSDIDQAMAWAGKSRDARESDLISKRRKELADYNNDLDRIEKAYGSLVAQRKQQYDTFLRTGDSLLDQNKFAEARSTYEKLIKMDPSRPEGQAGVGKVDFAKKNYLTTRETELKLALATNKFDEADGIIAQIKQIDPGYTQLPILEANVKAARKKKADEEAAALAKANQPETRPEQPKTQPKTTTRKEPTSEELARQQDALAARHKAQVRAALLETLVPYRMGDPKSALTKLQEINVKDADKFASYHWFKGLFILGIYHVSDKPDEALLADARNAFATVAGDMPNFTPDPNIYPEYILTFYREVRNQ